MAPEDFKIQWAPTGIASKHAYSDTPDEAESTVRGPIRQYAFHIMHAVIVLHYALSEMIQKHFAEK